MKRTRQAASAAAKESADEWQPFSNPDNPGTQHTCLRKYVSLDRSAVSRLRGDAIRRVREDAARYILTLLGAAAFLLTGIAASLRFASQTDRFKWLDGVDMAFMIAVLGIYAVMGAITFYEKGTDKTTAYFRQMTTILAIRDLWTKVQFELLKELRALKDAADPKAAEPAAREKIRALASNVCRPVHGGFRLARKKEPRSSKHRRLSTSNPGCRTFE